MKPPFYFLILSACLFAFAGCASLPLPGFLKKKSAPVPAEAAAPAAPAETPAGSEPPSAEKKTFWDRVFFWRKPKPPAARPLTSSARIFLVNEPGGFVVLEGPGVASLPEGTMLSALSEGRVTGTFRIAPERRPPLAIAEIVTGKATPGELLYPVR